MQTFIADPRSFNKTAEVLDNKRLNKQALEGWQILMTLLELDPDGNHRDPKGWRNHPAVKMWRGHETALYIYIQAMVTEWKRRGFNSTIGDKAKATILRAEELGLLQSTVVEFPAWMADSAKADLLAQTHRIALLCKNYEWYSQFDWLEDTGERPDSYQYVWPDENNELVPGQRNIQDR